MKGWFYEGPDESVGLFGGGWIHEDCDEEGAVDERHLATVTNQQNGQMDLYYLLTCDCGQQRIVTDYDWDPSVVEAMEELDQGDDEDATMR